MVEKYYNLMESLKPNEREIINNYMKLIQKKNSSLIKDNKIKSLNNEINKFKNRFKNSYDRGYIKGYEEKQKITYNKGYKDGYENGKK